MEVETPAAGTDGEQLDLAKVRDRVEFAALLTLLRNRAGLPVRTVARLLDQPAATIGGYFSGQHLPSVSQTELFRSLLKVLGVSGEQQVIAWLDTLARIRLRPGPRPALRECPYPGLENFRAEDESRFYGRDRLIAAIVQKLHDLLAGEKHAIGVTVGASGSGKSSLLQAGVIPAVLDGRIGDGRIWRTATFCPGERPMDALAKTMAELGLVHGTDLQAESLLQSENTAAALLVVDQFEEIFTTCSDEQERQQFLATLSDLATPTSDLDRPTIAVLLGLRSDFYARAALEHGLVPVLQESQVIVNPLVEEELRQAIVEPARLVGGGIDDDLVELLLRELAPRDRNAGAHDAGVLPLLSHALQETWASARGGRMTSADYRNTGGIAGAVQESAEETFLDLSDHDQALARRVFLRLINVDDAVTRRRVRWNDLPGCTCASDEWTECPLHGVVGRFVANRLLTLESDTVEISHEALLSAWRRLREWINADREGISLRRRLHEAVRLWEESNQDDSLLLRGGRLEITLAWAQDREHHEDLVAAEQLFLKASADNAHAERRSARRRLRRLQILAAVIAALAIFAAGLANVAIGARNSANEARDIALSRQLAVQAIDLGDSDPSLAMQLALLAYQIHPTLQGRSALIDSSILPASTRILGRPGAKALALSADGGLMAVSEAGDGGVQLFALTGQRATKLSRLAVPGVEADLYSVTFSPDGTMVASGGTEGVIRLWDIADPRDPKPLGDPLEGYSGSVWALEFSRDGKILTGAGDAPSILRWDLSDPLRPVQIEPISGAKKITQTFALSPDGMSAAAGGTDGIVRLWALDDLNSPVELPPTETTITAVAFSPDGGMLAAGGKDKIIRLWKLGGPTPERIDPALGGFGSWVNDLAFSNDGSVLAAGGSDNTIQFWNTVGWQSIGPKLTTSSPVTQLSFRPGGTNLINAGSDGTTRLWSWPGPAIGGADDNIFGLSYSGDGSRLAVLPNKASSVGIWDTADRQHPKELGRVSIPKEIGTVGGTGAISPDGNLLATGMAPRFEVQLWDITDPREPSNIKTLTGPVDLIEGIVFSPDGRHVAAGGDDGVVYVWEIGGSAPLTKLAGPEGQVLGVDFSPGGKLLAAASSDNSVWLWDVTNLAKPKQLAELTGFENYVYSVAFSPDGTMLAAGSSDKTVRLWDVSDPERPRQLGEPISGPGNYVFALAFSPTEPVLAAAVTDGNVWQWDIENPAEPRALTTLNGAETDQVFAVRYSPGGETLLATDGKVVRLWEPDPARLGRLICAESGDLITKQEWENYLPGLPYNPPCRGD